MPRDHFMKVRARELRRNQNSAEARVWHLLRDRRLAGFKFRRQRVLGPYIVDFVCIEARLVVEIDGDTHVDPHKDAMRTTAIERLGYKVIRFWNAYVYDRESAIGDMILDALREAMRPSPRPSPLTGRGRWPAPDPVPLRGEGEGPHPDPLP